MKGDCDNCGEYSEELQYWHTGARLCPKCNKEWDEKDKKMREELMNELKGGEIDKFLQGNAIKEIKEESIEPVKKKKISLEDWF